MKINLDNINKEKKNIFRLNRIFYIFSMMELSILNNLSMEKLLLLTILLISACFAADCDLGQIRINNTCTSFNFIEGCALYRNDG